MWWGLGGLQNGLLMPHGDFQQLLNSVGKLLSVLTYVNTFLLSLKAMILCYQTRHTFG